MGENPDTARPFIILREHEERTSGLKASYYTAERCKGYIPMWGIQAVFLFCDFPEFISCVRFVLFSSDF